MRVDRHIGRWRDRAASEAATVWTGHQPWHWHPGILAKYFAADAASTPSARFVNLVVDHDVQDALSITWPVRKDAKASAWSSRTLRLAMSPADVPSGCQPAVDANAVVDTLREAAMHHPDLDLETLIEAWNAQTRESHESLGRQMAGVLSRLVSPWLTTGYDDRFSTQLCKADWFGDELAMLIDDAAAMAAAYNRAVSKEPGARIGWLGVSREWVELPVWLLGWNRPRRRVYADVSDSHHVLMSEDGEHLDWERGLGRRGVWLAPKALWMTALIRRRVCDCAGFIHGTGGVTYDLAMERWWSAWRGEPLAPMGLATADITLDLPGPSATRNTLDRAVWLEHHLPHNLNQVPSVAAAHPELVAEKAELLDTMHMDRDRPRRRAAFDRIHTINAALSDAHHVLIDRVARERREAEAGRSNETLRKRRDWCFALYPPEVLNDLRAEVRGASEVPNENDPTSA